MGTSILLCLVSFIFAMISCVSLEKIIGKRFNKFFRRGFLVMALTIGAINLGVNGFNLGWQYAESQ
jgi:hypothetical protein